MELPPFILLKNKIAIIFDNFEDNQEPNTGKIIDEHGNSSEQIYSMFVRDIDNGVITSVNPMGQALEAMKLVKINKIGKCSAKLMNALDVFNATKNVPHYFPHLLREIK